MPPATTAGPNCSAWWWIAPPARKYTTRAETSTTRRRTMSTTETRFDGVRVRYESTKSYDELVAALLADIGEKPVLIDDVAAANEDWESYRGEVETHVGSSGFMLFGLLDHGAWITKTGIERKVLRVILGNP